MLAKPHVMLQPLQAPFPAPRRQHQLTKYLDLNWSEQRVCETIPISAQEQGTVGDFAACSAA